MIPTVIVVHCSATEDSGTVSWSAIRRYHMYDRGWQDIGYHAGIELVGSNDYEVFLGRPLDKQGAHCRAQGMNGHSIGFCFVGDYDTVAPSTRIIETGARHIAAFCRIFKIAVRDIYGHRDFEKNKTCPGLKFDMEMLRSRVAQYL